MRLVSLLVMADQKFSGASPDPGASSAPWRVYNIGNNRPVELLDVVRLLEEAIGKKAKRELLPMQPGDVPLRPTRTLTILCVMSVSDLRRRLQTA